MKVYHGSLDAVINPVIKEPRGRWIMVLDSMLRPPLNRLERWVLRKLDVSTSCGMGQCL